MSDKEAKAIRLQDRIAQLRQTFQSQLPWRLAELRRLHARLSQAEDAEAVVDLHRALHSLKGTGRSFGFTRLGDVASTGEDMAADLIEHPGYLCSSEWLGRFSEALQQIYIEMDAGILEEAEHVEHGAIPPRPELLSDTQRKLIYICDDDALQLELLASQLHCFGYDSSTFLDPDNLRLAVLAQRPDAIILDIHFPQGNDAGTKMLSALAQETGHPVPAIFVSMREDFAARLAAIQAGGGAYFLKPAGAMELVAALDELTQNQEPETYRILIVDDEPEIADYHALLLQDAGMRTHTVNDPATILDVLRDFRPDMVLMDMYMPLCSGSDLARLIRQVPDHVGLPIVYLSSETDKQKQFSAMRVGAEGFLTKPVVPVELISAVAIRAERMRTLRSLMARDGLTGLFNHTTTTQLLTSAISSAKRNHGLLCFAMIDIDLFKSVNDSYGHSAGDQVIIAIARVLQQRLRNSDIVGRFGGEEFAVILPDILPERAFVLIDGLRQDFAKLRFHAGGGDFSCTFSAGIAGYPERLEHLREAADKALYEAKRGGRNCVRMG